MSAKRVQRKRGVALPAGVVYVGRPTVFGNPFSDLPREESIATYRRWLEYDMGLFVHRDRKRAVLTALPGLRGKDLACWCPLDLSCHADVLLDLANREVPA